MKVVELAIENTTAFAIFLLDPHATEQPVTYCNLEFERLTGYSKKDVVGYPIGHRHLAHANSEALECIKKGLTNAREATSIVVALRKNGEPYRSRLTVTPIRDSQGELTQFMGIQTTLPEVSETQRALTQAQLFLESAPDATFIIDESGNLVLTNREAELLFGYTERELKSMPIEALMPARYRHQHLSHRNRFFEKPTVREMGAGMSIVALTKNGIEFPVDIRLSPIRSDGKQFYSASVRDISARVHVENALEDARDIAERATAVKSRFLAAASHDLRQPLQAISLYLSVLGRTTEPSKRDEISTKMQLSLDNINSMLSALLDVSKLDSGAIQPEKAEVRLQPVLDKIVAGSLQQATAKGLTLQCKPVSAVVYTDPGLLERVIDNFVTNAIRYTFEGGVSIQCRRANQYLAIEVHDTGIGIDHDQLDQVFEEYYQLDNPVRSRNKGLGLGLGLSIVKHVAKLLGHTVDVRSEVNSGSVFSISVPIVQFDSGLSESGEQHPAITKLRKVTPLVLLVDDDPDVLDSTSMLLESVGIKVSTASDSKQALAQLNKGLKPAIIISDFRLPGMNGIELITKARNQLQHEVPAIIITGDTATHELQKKLLPNLQVVYKPVDTDQLLTLLNDMVATTN